MTLDCKIVTNEYNYSTIYLGDEGWWGPEYFGTIEELTDEYVEQKCYGGYIESMYQLTDDGWEKIYHHALPDLETKLKIAQAEKKANEEKWKAKKSEKLWSVHFRAPKGWDSHGTYTTQKEAEKALNTLPKGLKAEVKYVG